MNNDVVIIELDRPRQLKFTHTALKTLMSITGQSIEELDGQLDVYNFEFLEQMAYCGLLRDAKERGETLDPKNIADLLDEAPSFVHVIEKVVAAWRVAFGAPPQTAEGNPLAPAEGTPANENLSIGKNPFA